MGKNEIANPNVESNVGIQDELGQLSIQQTIDNLNKEVQVFEENKESMIKGKENYLKQWAIDKRLLELQIEGDNIRPLDPKTKLEASDEYWSLVKEKIAFKLRFDEYQANQQLEGYDKQIETFQEQIDSAKAKLKEMGVEYA